MSVSGPRHGRRAAGTAGAACRAARRARARRAARRGLLGPALRQRLHGHQRPGGAQPGGRAGRWAGPDLPHRLPLHLAIGRGGRSRVRARDRHRGTARLAALDPRRRRRTARLRRGEAHRARPRAPARAARLELGARTRGGHGRARAGRQGTERAGRDRRGLRARRRGAPAAARRRARGTDRARACARARDTHAAPGRRGAELPLDRGSRGAWRAPARAAARRRDPARGARHDRLGRPLRRLLLGLHAHVRDRRGDLRAGARGVRAGPRGAAGRPGCPASGPERTRGRQRGTRGDRRRRGGSELRTRAGPRRRPGHPRGAAPLAHSARGAAAGGQRGDGRAGRVPAGASWACGSRISRWCASPAATRSRPCPRSSLSFREGPSTGVLERAMVAVQQAAGRCERGRGRLPADHTGGLPRCPRSST